MHDRIGLLLVSAPGGGRSGGECAPRICFLSTTSRRETKVSRVKKIVLRAGVAVTLACALAACASSPQKTDSQRAEDKAVAERVETALNSDKDLYAKHITARADNGVVRLTGYV